jgi:hypothetical protein
MKTLIKTVIYSISLAGCLALALTMSIVVIVSWTGGQGGAVGLNFNIFHERLAESILFPIWTIIGCIATYSLLKKSIDNIDNKKTIAYLQQKIRDFSKQRNPFLGKKDPCPPQVDLPAPKKD